LEGDGEFGIGLLDADAVADLEEFVSFAQVVEADAGGFVGGGFDLEVVFDQNVVFLLLEDADIKGFGGGNNVMLDTVFDEELEAESGEPSAHHVRPDVDVYMQEGFESGLDHIDVRPQEFELFVEADGLAGIFAE
jgi:hypothetical protein